MFSNLLTKLKQNEETVSTWIGVVVTVLVASLFFVYFRSVNKGQSGQITEIASKTEYKQVDGITSDLVNQLPVTYSIKKGDTLWRIAESVYGDGFLWEEIAENNKSQITNPNNIEVGTKIVIPKIESQETVTYTVQKGDNLWKIAQNQCSSGYQWSSIAAQNQLVSPGIIHAGNVLKFKCR